MQMQDENLRALNDALLDALFEESEIKDIVYLDDIGLGIIVINIDKIEQ